jgi:hypothetical protein
MHTSTTATTATDPILAIDPGKYKSVACIDRMVDDEPKRCGKLVGPPSGAAVSIPPPDDPADRRAKSIPPP